MPNPFREDPRWRAARDRYIADLVPDEPDEPNVRLMRRALALFEMAAIETEADAHPPA